MQLHGFTWRLPVVWASFVGDAVSPLNGLWHSCQLGQGCVGLYHSELPSVPLCLPCASSTLSLWWLCRELESGRVRLPTLFFTIAFAVWTPCNFICSWEQNFAFLQEKAVGIVGGSCVDSVDHFGWCSWLVYRSTCTLRFAGLVRQLLWLSRGFVRVFHIEDPAICEGVVLVWLVPFLPPSVWLYWL